MLTAQKLYDALLAAYGEPQWWSDDPYTVMFQAVLVQNTAWSSVEKTCAAIGEPLSPAYIDSLGAGELEELIRPCGFYKGKARTIHALTDWYRGYGFDRRTVQQKAAEQLRKELLAIRGVGAETADVILVYAFLKPSFVIDAYTRRFLSRMGYSFSDVEAIRRFFEEGLPADAQIYGWCHWLILEHCIAACKKTPRCSECPLQVKCSQQGGEGMLV